MKEQKQPNDDIKTTKIETEPQQKPKNMADMARLIASPENVIPFNMEIAEKHSQEEQSLRVNNTSAQESGLELY